MKELLPRKPVLLFNTALADITFWLFKRMSSTRGVSSWEGFIKSYKNKCQEKRKSEILNF